MRLGVLDQIHLLQGGQSLLLCGCAAQPRFRQHAVPKKLKVHILHDEEGPSPSFLSAQEASAPQDRPGLLFHQTAQAPGQSGLARPVVTGNGCDLPPGCGKGHILPDCSAAVGSPKASYRQTARFRCWVRLRQRHLRQTPQTHGAPFLFRQSQELPPGVDPLQLPFPQIEHPVCEVGGVPQAVLRHQDGFSRCFQPP